MKRKEATLQRRDRSETIVKKIKKAQDKKCQRTGENEEVGVG